MDRQQNQGANLERRDTYSSKRAALEFTAPEDLALKLDRSIGLKTQDDLFSNIKGNSAVVDILLMCTSQKVFLKTISFASKD